MPVHFMSFGDRNRNQNLIQSPSHTCKIHHAGNEYIFSIKLEILLIFYWRFIMQHLLIWFNLFNRFQCYHYFHPSPDKKELIFTFYMFPSWNNWQILICYVITFHISMRFLYFSPRAPLPPPLLLDPPSVSAPVHPPSVLHYQNQKARNAKRYSLKDLLFTVSAISVYF